MTCNSIKTLTPNAGVDDLNLQQNQHLDPIAGRSGLSETDKQGTKDTLTTSNRTNLMVSPQEFNQAYQEWQGSPMYQNQMEGEQLQNSLAMLDAARPLPLDLRPLAAWADSLGGSSKLEASMPVPETAQARSQAILTHFQQVQQDRNALSTNIMQGLKAMKGGGYQLSMEQAMQNASIQQSANDPLKAMRLVPQETRVHWVDTGLQKDMQEVKDAASSADLAQRLLASGSSVSDMSFKDKFLKAAIGGRLSNYDLISQSGDRGAMDRLNQAWTTLNSGSLTDKNRAEYADALRTMIDSNQRESALRLGAWHDKGVNSYGLPEEVVAPMVNPAHYGMAPLPPSTLTNQAVKTQHAIQKADPSFESPTVPKNTHSGQVRVTRNADGKAGWMNATDPALKSGKYTVVK